MSGLLVDGPRGGRLGQVAGHAGAHPAGRMVTAHLGNGGEAGLTRLETGHGALIVDAVERLVVVHDFGLMLGVGDGVPHVLASSAYNLVKVGPLQDVTAQVLSHM